MAFKRSGVRSPTAPPPITFHTEALRAFHRLHGSPGKNLSGTRSGTRSARKAGLSTGPRCYQNQARPVLKAVPPRPPGPSILWVPYQTEPGSGTRQPRRGGRSATSPRCTMAVLGTPVPKQPRQSVCAVIAFGFAFVLVAVLLEALFHLGLAPPPDCWAARNVDHLWGLLFLLMQVFAFIGFVRIAKNRDKVKGGPFLTGTVVIIGMVWITRLHPTCDCVTLADTQPGTRRKAEGGEPCSRMRLHSPCWCLL